MTSYLLYTLYEAFYQVRVAGDFYRVLGVSPLADDKTIKSRFRRLAALHHPDKVQQQQQMMMSSGGGDGFASSSSAGSGPDAFFVYLKLAHDTLLDPVRRFAYDRFGPEILEIGAEHRKTMQDYVRAALYRMLPQYVGGFLMIMFMNLVWWPQWGRYVSFSLLLDDLRSRTNTKFQWRFYTFAALITLELSLITHPLALFMPEAYLPAGLRSLLGLSDNKTNTPPGFYLLPFQILTLARRAAVTLHIFISQVTPPEVAKSSSSSAGQLLSPQTLQRLRQLVQLAQATDVEATRLLQLSFAPFRGDPESVATLRRGMKEGLVLGGVRNSPEVKEAVERVLERRKRERESARAGGQ